MKKFFFFFGVRFLLFAVIILPQNKVELSKLTGNTSVYSKFNINKISTFIYNTGVADISSNGNAGFIYPKGSWRNAVFASGLVWGGKVNGEIRTGGSTYWSGLSPGKILSDGKAEDPNSTGVRVFRVRRDYKSADLSMESDNEGKSQQAVYSQYEKDWNEWPADKGAQYEDVDSNGKYNPSIDYPGVPGADQTLWFVANDLDSVKTKSLYGSLPMGIEMQTTVWGYNASAPLGNIVFKKYLLINKSKNNFNEMYIGIWSDPDLGDAGDDYVGCDTTLDVGYVYNGKIVDLVYSPLKPPSIGFCLLRGPIVEGMPDDVAYFGDRKIYGKRNLHMTAFCNVYKNGGGVWHAPMRGDYKNGTLFLYNMLQGLLGDGTPHPLPISMGNGTTKFPYSGDPVNGTGFIGKNAFFPGAPWAGYPSDKTLMVCSGPFNMAPGDTQEVVFAQVAAGAVDNIDYLSAITYMKSYTAFAKIFFGEKLMKYASRAIPSVTATALNNEIVLNWGEDENNIKQIETGYNFYKFQGYNVYQFPNIASKFKDGKRIATFDIVDGIGKIMDAYYDSTTSSMSEHVSQFGQDTGIQRFISIKNDILRNKLLSNGNDYCFGVTQYSYSDLAVIPKAQESGFNMIRIKPQAPPPGVRYTYNFGDIISAVHVSGSSSAEVTAMVVDPTKLTNDNYEITFNSSSNGISFSLSDITVNKTLLSNQTNLTGNNDYIVTDGFVLKVKNDASFSLTENDIYQLKTTAAGYNQKLAQEDVEKINVFPNPYYGVNRMETNKYERIVTFTHLPQRATVRIFNLAGQLVRKLEKNSTDTFLRWDLLNESRYQAPSGIYIVHIELPDIGKSKILKMAIIQEHVMVDWYNMN